MEPEHAMPITQQANGEPLLKWSSSYSHSFPVCSDFDVVWSAKGGGSSYFLAQTFKFNSACGHEVASSSLDDSGRLSIVNKVSLCLGQRHFSHSQHSLLEQLELTTVT